jgi:hypothetical protein
MSNFIKTNDPLTWVYNRHFAFQYIADDQVKIINRILVLEYDINSKVYYRSLQSEIDDPDWGWEVFIEFENEADDAAFIMKES